MDSAFHQVSCGQKKERRHHRGKINDIPAIDHPPADTPVMGIDAQHFDEITGAAFENRQCTQCRKSGINDKTGKGA